MLEPLREDTSVPSLSRCPLPEEALLQLSARDPVMRSYVAEIAARVPTRSGPPAGTVMRCSPDTAVDRRSGLPD